MWSLLIITRNEKNHVDYFCSFSNDPKPWISNGTLPKPWAGAVLTLIANIGVPSQGWNGNRVLIWNPLIKGKKREDLNRLEMMGGGRNVGLLIYYFCFVWGPHPAVLWGCSIFCAQEWPLSVPGIPNTSAMIPNTRGALRNAGADPHPLHSIQGHWLIQIIVETKISYFFLQFNVFPFQYDLEKFQRANF